VLLSTAVNAAHERAIVKSAVDGKAMAKSNLEKCFVKERVMEKIQSS
jgi:hypothetical protein